MEYYRIAKAYLYLFGSVCCRPNAGIVTVDALLQCSLLSYF